MYDDMLGNVGYDALDELEVRNELFRRGIIAERLDWTHARYGFPRHHLPEHLLHGTRLPRTVCGKVLGVARKIVLFLGMRCFGRIGGRSEAD